MGEVYRARDTRLERDVALKVLPARLAAEDTLSRFERESKAVAALTHPNIVAIFDVGTAEGVSYAALELLEGETLRSRLAAGALPARKAVDFAIQIARGLAAAHAAGVVHRDLKPENLFMAAGGRVKILDFGLARQEEPAETEDTRSPTLAVPTEPGTVLGTAGYMAPEQARGETVDHRADIFALGCVLHEMLTGQRAFSGESAADTLAAILKEEPPEVEELAPRAPVGLGRIVRHCIEKNPADRFQAASDVAFDLEAVSAAASESGRRPAAGAGRMAWKRAWPWVLAALVAAGAYLAGRTGPPESGLRYARASFGRGIIKGARFAPDGQSIVYAASWAGRPSQVYLKRPDGLEAAPVGPEDASLLAVSRTGELAILLEPRPRYHMQSSGWTGTLARLPIDGGLPTEIQRGVTGADWSPDGSELAIVRDVGAMCRLELPPGNVLYETRGWLSSPRFSPDGSLIAVSEHPSRLATHGWLGVVGRAGEYRRLTERDARGDYAWAPGGREIWYGSAIPHSVRAVSLSGRSRELLRVHEVVEVGDVSSDGRVLLTLGSLRGEVAGVEAGDDGASELGWLGWSLAKDLSPDGRTLLFYEGLWMHAGAISDVLATRGTDAGEVRRYTDASTGAFSPDGRWIATGHRALVVRPVGPGEAKPLESGPVERYEAVAWLPDGERLVFSGRDPERGLGLYVQSVAGGSPRPISPPQPHLGALLAPSPSGTAVAAQGIGGQTFLFPVEGGEPRPFPGLGEGDIPIRFGTDDETFYFYRVLPDAAYEVYRLDVPSGRRERMRYLAPADRTGVMAMGGVVTTADAALFAFTYLRWKADLFVVEGLR